MTPRSPLVPVAAALVALGVALLAHPARAQEARGFLFRPPAASLTLRAGHAAASARGDVFAFSSDLLTLGRDDFRGFAFGADLAIASPGSRVDVVVSVDHASASAPSEFRDWVGTDDQPIRQTTTFRRVPVSAGVRAYLLPRGQAVGTLAWVPARVVPWVTGGVGSTWYRFRQSGEFVDFANDEIFADDVETSGWGPSAYAGGGVDFSLGPRSAITAEARWQWSRAGTRDDFQGFDDVDLSGLATMVGITFRL